MILRTAWIVVLALVAFRPAPGFAQDAEPLWVGEPISLSMRDERLVDVIREVALRASHRLALEVDLDSRFELGLASDPVAVVRKGSDWWLRVEAASGLSGLVTVVFDRVPWDQALHEIARINHLEARVVGDAIVIVDSRERKGLTRWNG